MDTKQPEALRIAEWLEGTRGNTWPSYIPQEAAAELRRQHAEIETLRAGYDAARLEIESLKERVQQLGQLARDVNSRRVVEPAAATDGWQLVPAEPTKEMKAAAVKFANGDDVYKNVSAGVLQIEEEIYGEAYEAMLAAVPSEPAQPAANAGPEDAAARFKAQHEFLIWSREQTPPPIESATEYSVFNQAVDFYIAARAAQGGAA